MLGPRRGVVCCVALAALSLGASATASTRTRTRPRAHAAGGSALRVTQVEYRLGVSGATVRAGRVSLEVLDRGRDPHDLRLRALAGGPQIAAPQLRPGQRWSATVRLRPGVYRLWCSLPEHARLGMRTTLTVVG